MGLNVTGELRSVSYHEWINDETKKKRSWNMLYFETEREGGGVETLEVKDNDKREVKIGDHLTIGCFLTRFLTKAGKTMIQLSASSAPFVIQGNGKKAGGPLV